jgi:hypothetical protein
MTRSVIVALIAIVPTNAFVLPTARPLPHALITQRQPCISKTAPPPSVLRRPPLMIFGPKETPVQQLRTILVTTGWCARQSIIFFSTLV